ncbi:MAG: glycosyltransferase family 39 protein [Candidatus Hydrogenedentes bacterium]|nr:glycosyltransferase family 39 protein [Candidatus Hydrogenedentota bacterium]
MSNEQSSSSMRGTGFHVAGGLALLALAAHLATNHRFGFHHDELYFLACGQHFDLGYVDHPPLVPWLARLSYELFGDSLRGLRLWSALAHAATILLVARIARELGGRAFAQGIAALAVFMAPVFMRTGNILAIPSFEALYWAVATLLVIRILKGGGPKWWLAVGLVAGIGLLNKHTMLFWGAGLTAGLILTPHRQMLKSPWIYAGGAVAGLVFLPNVVWQMQHGWDTVQFIRQLNAETMSEISRVEFAAGQLLYQNPFAAPLWLAGLIFAFTPAGKPWRLFGWMYLTLFVFLLVVKSKIYYLSPVYPMLFALGGVAWEHWFAEGRKRAAQPLLAAAVAAGGLALAPVSLPLLSIDATDRYVKAATMGIIESPYELTGDLHGEFGWQEIAAGVGEAYQALPEEDKNQLILFGSNYGIAGALDLWGSNYGLPPAHSNVLSYHRWGLSEPCCGVVLAVTTNPKGFSSLFNDITEIASIHIPEQNPWARTVHVLLCKSPAKDLRQLWPEIFEF